LAGRQCHSSNSASRSLFGYRHDFSRCIRSYNTGRSSGRDYWIRQLQKGEERYDTGTANPNEERVQAQLTSKSKEANQAVERANKLAQDIMAKLLDENRKLERRLAIITELANREKKTIRLPLSI